ncbi:aspartate transaminase [Synchytrium microbalum]|uniref:Aspartate aminotransferase n=1 Tax=Synchytrium microbalum TaxID=1806994 RepID=A0A507C8Z1_9FUNG|nr:aspartate transaminase [Synchytrium microbalum]TPX34456.1 aspartate transaminase [Synchytrium microbalum]
MEGEAAPKPVGPTDRLSQLQACLDRVVEMMYIAVGALQRDAPLVALDADIPVTAFTEEQNHNLELGGRELATKMGRDIVRTFKVTEFLINSLPGIDKSEEEQLDQLRVLEEENRIAGRDMEAAVERAGQAAGPPDPILGVSEAFKADSNPKKMNLGVGAYRDDKGKPYVLNCVKKAEEIIFNSKMDHEYLPISGLAEFNKLSIGLAYGDDSAPLKAGNIVAAQSLSGTGALRMGGIFLSRFWPGTKKIFVPSPTWGNHNNVFKDSGLEVGTYKYFDKKTNGLDFDGMLGDFKAMPNNSLILLHACAHNPTGVDPTKQQWAAISDVCKQKSHFVFFDMAYQGFASGDPTIDAFALRHFVAEGHKPILAQSYAKNLGLYGERVGCFSIVTDSPTEAKAVDSQVKISVRPIYSNPPLAGARIVKEVLGRPELRTEWYKEVKMMADRIISMRAALKKGLVETNKSKKNWDHVTAQIGMFAFTGLTPDQVARLRSEFSIYMTGDGRISIAGINTGNVDYLASAIHNVTK